jgi:putative ABC transport system ATP-binding protein
VVALAQAGEVRMSATADVIIKTDQVWRVYKVGALEVPALRGIDLHIEAGTFVALQGRSGSGKTTLLNCLGGLDQPTSGSIEVLGQNITHLSDAALTRWRREQVGFVFQSFGLIPTLSAYENVELMLRIKGGVPKDSQQRAQTCLDMVGLKPWQHHRPYELSGGQQQRVAIARALANEPRLILADEPTGELDSTTAREVLALFKQIVRNEHVTLLMVSHDPLTTEYAERVLHLNDGQIIEHEG